MQETSKLWRTFFDTSIGEMSEQGIDDRLNYLSDRIISDYDKIIKEPSEKELEFKLSDAQRVLLRLFLGKYSYILGMITTMKELRILYKIYSIL